MVKYEEDVVEGSGFVFFLFRTAGVLMVILGGLVVVTSIYIWILLDTFTLFDGIIFAVGMFTILIALYSFTLRDSLMGLSLYILVLFFFVICQFIACTIILASGDKVASYVLDSLDEETKKNVESQISAHIEIITYIMVLMLLTTCGDVIIGFWYRKTLKEMIDSNLNSAIHAILAQRIT